MWFVFMIDLVHLIGDSLIKKLTDINRCLTDPANRCLTDVQPTLTDTISHTLHIQS